MRLRIDDLLDRAAALERDIESELNRAGASCRYRLVAGRVRFEREARLAHRRLKQGVPQFLRQSSVLNIVTAPIVYSMIVPIALLDVWVSLYQIVCFRVYGISRVPRSTYIVFDRHQLAYLNWVEKLSCVYCGYTNGVFAYVREIAGRTEQYWCPIRHAKRVRAPHFQYRHFVEYGDAEGYRKRLIPLREELKDDRPARDR
jgi:hypothetical protein